MKRFGIQDKENIVVNEIIITDKFLKRLLDLALVFGSLGFIFVAISSYLNYNLLFFINAASIVFFPQGLIMLFYGLLGLLLGIKQILTSYFQLGEGYNFFNKKNGDFVIYRIRFPLLGDNIYLIYKIVDIVRDYNFINLMN